MSSNDAPDENVHSKSSVAPYTAKHPIPTVQGYRSKQENDGSSRTKEPSSQEQAQKQGDNSSTEDGADKEATLRDTLYQGQASFDGKNRNIQSKDATPDDHGANGSKSSKSAEGEAANGDKESNGHHFMDIMKKFGDKLDPRLSGEHQRADTKVSDREVTDPVTHLPVKIHDLQKHELASAPENEPPPGMGPKTATGLSGKSKSESQLAKETEEEQKEHEGMQSLFPPPDFDATSAEITRCYSAALNVGLASIFLVILLLLVGIHAWHLLRREGTSTLELIASSAILLAVGLVVESMIAWTIRNWLDNRIRGIWEDELWHASRQREQKQADSPVPESTQWLNSILSSVWSLINPDLFTSLADTLEDVMQNSLPKLVRMISVEDLGQGSEAIRILGVRWLPTGAAAMNVSEDGKLDKTPNSDDGGQKSTQAQDADEMSQKDKQSDDSNGEKPPQGLQAEEGDFVNVEVAFSYRASVSGRSLAVKSKSAHLYLAFYLPSEIRLPVWVELRGIVGTMRLRLQLCPDPPFFSLCTLTFLGQPKVDLSCVPLVKKGLNLMDLPLISSFVQSSIDAALAEYVAPRSLTLDLKDMLTGSDFKKDTNAHGIIMVHIKRGRDFKEGDPGLLGLKKGSSDAYVAVGWAKFAKPIWSTRVILEDMEPVWDETAFILVGPEELNAEERLRVQLWDSDRTSADDDLGRIEVDLKELMNNKESCGKQWDRSDTFLAMEGDGEMPGTLDWSVGYYPKTTIHEEQMANQKIVEDVSSIDDLRTKVAKDAEGKLREAEKDDVHELDQQKAQDVKDTEEAIIISTPPLKDYHSGVLSVQIHQITGLELEQTKKKDAQHDEGDETAEGSGDLPSSYCNVILNHQTIFKTRTKPKNAKPFFNAGTERLIRDWRSTELIVAVRDSRVHENDPLLGLVYLPLGKIFQDKSQVVGNYPLVGGVGYGRVRISLLFRSVQTQLPKPMLGWDYGTLEVACPVSSDDVNTDLKSLRIRVRTSLGKGKLRPSGDEEASVEWSTRNMDPIRLAVRKRYCSCLTFEFRKSRIGKDKSPAFAVLWLKDVPDDEDVDLHIPVWKATEKSLKRAKTNCISECGEKIGTIKLSLRFYRGLGAYHHKLASQSLQLQQVFEVLETAHDNKEVQMFFEHDEHEADSSDSSDSDEDDKESGTGEGKHHSKIDSFKDKVKLGNNKDDSPHENQSPKSQGSGNPLKHFEDYNAHSDQLHRRHRGIMQWKSARTANWLKTKAKQGRNQVPEAFKHHEREPEIETEV